MSPSQMPGQTLLPTQDDDVLSLYQKAVENSFNCVTGGVHADINDDQFALMGKLQTNLLLL